MMAANSDRDDLPLEPSTLLPDTADDGAVLHNCLCQLRVLEATCVQLQQALDNERDISLAIGITMMQRRLTRAEAFDLLRNNARSQRRKLAEVAADLVQAAQNRALSRS